MFPKISVIVPSFNKVKYIEATLKSIVDQNYKNLEVIIQDGGSTDGTLDIIRKYAEKFSYIKFESKKDNGQLDAINNGLSKATGEIVTFINADDRYRVDAFKSVAKSYSDNSGSLWFVGQGVVIDENGNEVAKLATLYKNIFLLLNHKSLLLILNYLMQPSVFITKSSFEKYGPFTGTKDFVTEYDLWLKLMEAQMPVVINGTLSEFMIESETKTATMSEKLLTEDEHIVRKYTSSRFVLLLHHLHNFFRIIFIKSL